VPTLENGLWKLLPDGRMETTWRLRPAARWQDGTPLTADDILFTAAVEQDRELEQVPYPEYDLIDSMAVPDARTITITWKRPYIEADALFSYRVAGLPMPKHILERPFNEDKGTFLALPYWSEEFVGAGAFRIREWVRDSHTVLRVNDDYVLGRPKIDEIEVRFIPDNNTLLANVLAGLDLTLGKTISLDMALQAKDQWKDGRLAVLPQNWTPLNPQFINPDPEIVGDLRFRRALLEALDRQQLADFVFSGQGSIAHSYVDPTTPLYNLVEPSIVKYEYDPRRAAQIIQGLGYTRRSDGFLYDPSGQKLSVSIQAPVQNDIHLKTIAPVADMWQQLGVAVEQVPVPVQRMTDREYRATFPAFEIVERRNSLTVSEIYRLHSSQTPLPENGFRAPGTSRYRHPELDAWIERYATTIPLPERMQALAGMVHHQTENLTQLPLFHGTDPTLISNRLLNVTARGDAFTQAWNVQAWDLR
jgi:peptide/nickel transport system substrate-binding protein